MTDSDPVVEALSAALGLPAFHSTEAYMKTLYHEVDAAIAASPGTAQAPCRSGCDACCREAVFVSAPEFVYVVAWLRRRWPVADREALHRVMAHWAHRFADEIECLAELRPGAERDEVAARIRFACPLLSDDGACRIYPVRELNARSFGRSWDEKRGAPYACGEATERLRVLPALETALPSAWAFRRRLASRFPGADVVRVYPDWFSRHPDWWRPAPEARA